MQERNEKRMIKNPVLPGYYPDPSVCRVGEDYYMVCSSFEMYPGLPLFHSKDLAHWEQISYICTSENDFHVSAAVLAGGVMAPTIRWHNGLFYVINANFGDKGNYIVTAADPRGPWSKPHWLPEITAIDASLFFDGDKAYIVSPGKLAEGSEKSERGVVLTEFSLETMKPAGEPVRIWDSALRGAASPEAPHLYHIGEYYYLIIAEGGTEHYHSVAVARSKELTGWYEGNPANPVMTHRHMGRSYPIANVGHADLVDTPGGNWYAVLLGSRLVGGPHKNLGRETYICPVGWEDGWPVFSPGSGKVEWEYPAASDLCWSEAGERSGVDDFTGAALGMEWNCWGTPYQDYWKIEDSRLKLKCLKRPVSRELQPVVIGKPDYRQDDCVSLIARRQQAICFEAFCQMEFMPEERETAGFIVLQALNHQYRLERQIRDGRQVLELMLVTAQVNGAPHMPGFRSVTTTQVLKSIEYHQNQIVIGVKANGQNYDFYYGVDRDHLQEFYTGADGKAINPEIIGGMMGTMIGMFASGNGAETNKYAEFDWFLYREQDDGDND